MNNNLLVAFSILSLSIVAPAAQATFLPPNNLYLQDNIFENINMSEAQFNNVINEVSNFYTPIVASHDARLIINKNWSGSIVNAIASQDGNKWSINMFGGLARRPEVTIDGLSAVVCHELGHHLAGYFFKFQKDYWAASEGEADYFATHVCLPNIWRNKTSENAVSRENVSSFIKQSCDNIWKNESEQNLCYRTARASESLANLLAAVSKQPTPSFETPSYVEVNRTSIDHPAAQCRLDTFLSGALCTKTFDNSLILGLNNPNGQNSVEIEKQSMNTTCHTASGTIIGTRPRCWYKPTLEFLPIKISNWEAKELGSNDNNIIEPGETAALNYTLLNATTNSTSKNIAGYLSTNSPGASIINAQQQYIDINPAQFATNTTPFLLKIDKNIQCGSKINLNFMANSDAGSMEQKSSITTGKPILVDFGTISANLPITDNTDIPIASTLNITKNGFARHIEVQLNIEHPRVSDLLVVLNSPDNKMAVLWQRNGADQVNLNTTISSDIDSQASLGDWKLRIADKRAGMVGKLISWGLKITQYECE